VHVVPSNLEFNELQAETGLEPEQGDDEGRLLSILKTGRFNLLWMDAQNFEAGYGVENVFS